MNTRFLSALTIGFLCSLQLLTLLWIFQHRAPERFGLVDTQAIVSLEAQRSLALYPKNQLPPEKINEIARRLKKRVAEFAEANQIILLAQAVVWGGTLPDYTESVIQWLKTEDEINAQSMP